MIYPEHKTAAVVFSIDDIHPASSINGYEAGGDLAKGVLGRLRQLTVEHSDFCATLFVTADWRAKSPYPNLQNRILNYIPGMGAHFGALPQWPEGFMSLDRHPDFVSYLDTIPRIEIGSHGLTHVGLGKNLIREFLGLSENEIRKRVSKIAQIFQNAGLKKPAGFCPPGWGYNELLLKVIPDFGYSYIACSRDLNTPIKRDAVCNESGIKNVSLVNPCFLPGSKIVHIPSNWSVTCNLDRAYQIIESGGVLSIKAHAVKKMGTYVSADGLDDACQNYLSKLFHSLKSRFGNSIWWTTMKELAVRYRDSQFSHANSS